MNYFRYMMVHLSAHEARLLSLTRPPLFAQSDCPGYPELLSTRVSSLSRPALAQEEVQPLVDADVPLIIWHRLGVPGEKALFPATAQTRALTACVLSTGFPWSDHRELPGAIMRISLV